MLDSFTFEQANEIRDTIREIILSTDMTVHFNILKDVQSIIE